MLLTQFVGSLNKFGCGYMNATFALNGLKQNRRRVFIDCLPQRITVIVRSVKKSGQQGIETDLYFFLTGRGDAAKGSAVKGAGAGNNVKFLRVTAEFILSSFPRELDQSVVRLCTTIAEKHPSRFFQHSFNDELCQFRLFPNAIQVGTMNQFGRLLRQRFLHHLWGVPERAHCDTTGEIQIFLSGLVPNSAAFAVREFNGKPSVVSQHILVGELFGGHCAICPG